MNRATRKLVIVLVVGVFVTAGCGSSAGAPTSSAPSVVPAITASSIPLAISTAASTATIPVTAAPTLTAAALATRDVATQAPPTAPPPPAPAQNLCGAPANPWGYTYCGGTFISAPPANFCSYFNCIATFANGRGYVIECQDLTLSKSGGISGSCSGHGGNLRALYAP